VGGEGGKICNAPSNFCKVLLVTEREKTTLTGNEINTERGLQGDGGRWEGTGNAGVRIEMKKINTD